MIVTKRGNKMNFLIDARQSYNDFYISNLIIDALDGGLDKSLASLNSLCVSLYMLINKVVANDE